MRGDSRRKQIRDRVRLEQGIADRWSVTVRDRTLRRQFAVVSINIEAIGPFFLDRLDKRTANDETAWLDAAEYWLQIHVGRRRALEYDVTPARTRPGMRRHAATGAGCVARDGRHLQTKRGARE